VDIASAICDKSAGHVITSFLGVACLCLCMLRVIAFIVCTPKLKTIIINGCGTRVL